MDTPSNVARRLSQLTAVQLIQQRQGATEVQGRAMVNTHVGLWLEIDGVVDNVSVMGNEIRVLAIISLRQGGFSSRPVMFANMKFDLRYEPLLTGLNKSDLLKAIGQVESVLLGSISLDHCEPIEYGIQKLS